MPSDRAPTPLSHTAISLGNSSEDRNSECSDNTATVEIFRIDCDPEPMTHTPSEMMEGSESENVSRHRTPIADDAKFSSNGDIPDVPLERRKSSGLSKGVILNAMNFGSYDLNCDPKEMKEKAAVIKEQELLDNGSNIPKAVEASSEINLKTADDEKGEEKKKMSLQRKIAFGFSFVPSVMFVLTFAVILPCEEYKYTGRCVENRWSLSLNHTEITSKVSLPESLLLGYRFMNSTGTFNGIANVNEKTGKEVWKIPLDSQPKYLECQKGGTNENRTEDCFAVLENGDVCAFNLSDGQIVWTFNSNSSEVAAVLLSGCPYYKDFKPMGVARYSKENTLSIDVLNSADGSVLASKEVKLDDKCITYSMKPWKYQNETDLVFLCEGTQIFGYDVRRIRQNLWCSPEEQSVLESQLLMRFHENETDSTYLPTPEGLLVWAGTQITFLGPDGNVKWQQSTQYVPQNRIAEFGSFYLGGTQVVLMAQNTSSIIVVSVHRSDDGKELYATSIAEGTLNQAVVLQGNKTDYLLISVLKVKATERENASTEIVLLSNASSPSDFRKDVPYKTNGNSSITEELILFQFEGKNASHVLLQDEIPVLCTNDPGKVCESEYQASHIISALAEEKENSLNLKIVMLETVDNNLDNDLKQSGAQLSSQLTALDITHQDNPDIGQSSCTL